MLDPEVVAALKQNGYISQPVPLSSEMQFADFMKVETARLKNGVIRDLGKISSGVGNYLPPGYNLLEQQGRILKLAPKIII